MRCHLFSAGFLLAALSCLAHCDGDALTLGVALVHELGDVLADGLLEFSSFEWHGLIILFELGFGKFSEIAGKLKLDKTIVNDLRFCASLY